MRFGDRRRSVTGRALLCLGWVCAVALASEGCARVSVDTIRLTKDRFPSKSVEQVDLLSRKSSRPYREVADLSARGESVSFERLQEALVKQAATLGADAIIVRRSETHLKEGVAYQPMYSPWGYYDPSYGPDPWGYGGPAYRTPYMAVPFTVDVRSLKATAVVYTDIPSDTR